MEICTTLCDQSKDLCVKHCTIDPRLMQYWFYPVEYGCDFRTSWLADLYDVCDESTQFYMSLKPWRLMPAQRRLKANTTLQICYDTSTEQLLKLLNNGLLASTILWKECDEDAKFDVLLTVFEILHYNIRKLYVTFGYNEVATPEEICRALVDLPRLRSLRVLKFDGNNQSGTWSAAVLFSHVRDGYVQMHPVYNALLNRSAVTQLAYKSLQMDINETVDFTHWTEYAHLCASLEHLTINLAYGFSEMPLLPPNLVSLAVISCSGHVFIRHTRSPQTHIKRLTLPGVNISWQDLVLWCPNVCVLELPYSRIEDPITASLHLTHLNMLNTLITGTTGILETIPAAYVRYMSNVTLHRLELELWEEVLDIEFSDFIANSDFLIGTDVTWRSHLSANVYRKKITSNKRATLFFLQSLIEIRESLGDIRAVEMY